jgi:hypothetical protein
MADAEKRERSLIPVLLVVMAVAGVLVFAGVYIFARYISEKVTMDVRDLRSGGKSVRIETPKGALSVGGEVTEAELGMPIYPGAERRHDMGASLSLEIPASGAFQVAAGEFETGDPLDQVARFYRERLGEGVEEKRLGGKMQFVGKTKDGGRKMVILRAAGRGARISMAHLFAADTN